MKFNDYIKEINGKKCFFFQTAGAKGHIEPKKLREQNLEGKVSERKLDGTRELMIFDDKVYITSRRVGVKNEGFIQKQDNIPHITNKYSEFLQGTVLDGEVYYPNSFNYSSGIMQSLPERAITIQEEKGKLKYMCYDILFYKYEDLRKKSAKERREFLKKAIKEWRTQFPELKREKHVFIINQRNDFIEFYNEEVTKKGEGIMIKDPNAPYGEGWYKVKKEKDVSVIITGFKPGGGKYTGKIGALLCSVYDGENLKEIAAVSGFDDALRNEMSTNFENYKGKPIDICTQEFAKDRLRHPRFRRFREDINAISCTMEKIKNDLLDYTI